MTLCASALLFLLLLEPAVGLSTATIGALVFALCQPVLTVFTYAWSESLMIPLILASVWLSVRCIEAAERGRTARKLTLVLLLTIALVLVVFTRYPGFLFAALLPWAWIASRDRRRWLPYYAVAALLYAAGPAWLAFRNQRLTGHLSGAERPASGLGLGENVSDFLAGLRLQISTEPLALAVALLLATALVALRTLRPGGEGERSGTYARRLLWTCLVACGAYSAGVLVLRTGMALDPIDTRYVSPAFVLLLLLAFVEIHRCWTRPGRAVLPLVEIAAGGALLALVAVQGITTYRSATSGWARYGTPRLPLSPDSVYLNYSTPPLADRVATEYELQKGLALAAAGRGDVERSVRHTRECLRLDHARATSDMRAMAAPFWEWPDLLDEGLRYYQELLADLPDAWWMHQNAAVLAERLGLAELSAEELRLARELQGPAKAE